MTKDKENKLFWDNLSSSGSVTAIGLPVQIRVGGVATLDFWATGLNPAQTALPMIAKAKSAQPNSSTPSSKKKVVRWILGLTALLALAATYPAYRAINIWRGRHLAEEAQSVLSKKPAEALVKAQSAVALAPADRYCLRTMAVVYAALNRGDAFRYWDRMEASGPLSAVDCQARIDLALDLKRLDLAEKHLKLVLSQPPLGRPVLRSASLFFALKGNNAGAIKTARAWTVAAPDDTDAKFFLARQLLATADLGLVEEAKALLVAVIDGKHPDWPQALQLVAALPDLTPAEVQQCIGFLDKLPTSDPRRNFTMIDLHLRLQPERTRELVEAAISYYRTGNAEVIQALTGWLSKRGEHARIIELMSPRVAKRDARLFLIYSDALAEQKQWSQLEQLLNGGEVPLDPIRLALYQARVAGELQKTLQKNSYWAQVHWLGSKNPEMLLYAAHYAARIGEMEEAAKACRRLTEDPKYAEAALSALIRWAQERGDTVRVRQLVAEMAKLSPENPSPKNDLAYLDLLSEQNIPEATAIAERLVKQYPHQLAYRTTLALAYLRAKNQRGAKDVYRDLMVRWPEVSPSWQAIYAATLGQSGATAEARVVAQRISNLKLAPREKDLIAPWVITP